MDDVSALWFDGTEILIGGQWRSTAETLTLEDPSLGADLARIGRGGEAEIDAAVGAARQALDGAWGRATAPERGRVLARLGALVDGHVDRLAELEARDVGKPLSQARADAKALARYMEFYSGAADKIHGTTIPYLEGYTVYTVREPHGVTGHIVPWNYPMQIIGRSVGAALAMGNACVLKPAEEACLTALAFARLAEMAGLPPGALNVVPGLGAEAGAALAAHPGVDHLSFTGSFGTGQSVQAAAAGNVVPVTLELGGKSPQIVFEDADLATALPFLVNAGIQNAGQTCSAASRILVHHSRLQEVAAAMTERYEGLRVGPAMADLAVGPLISARQKAIVEGYLAQGADLETLASGTIHPEAPEAGHYVAPRLLAAQDPGHVLAQEEIFGPVQVILPFADEDEAVAIANGTGLGLVAAVWTENGARQMRMAKRLRAGQVFSQHLWRGRRRRVAIWRCRSIRPWAGKGVRGALWVLPGENGGRAPRLRRPCHRPKHRWFWPHGRALPFVCGSNANSETRWFYLNAKRFRRRLHLGESQITYRLSQDRKRRRS